MELLGLKQGPFPQARLCCPNPQTVLRTPRNSDATEPDFGFLIPPRCQWSAGHRIRPPGLGTSPFHNVPSPTPRCEQMVRASVDPHLLPAFPRRRYGRLTQRRMTRLIRVHGYYGPLLCILRSRSLELSAHTFNPTSC